jgi:hypothetical protein
LATNGQERPPPDVPLQALHGLQPVFRFHRQHTIELGAWPLQLMTLTAGLSPAELEGRIPTEANHSTAQDQNLNNNAHHRS